MRSRHLILGIVRFEVRFLPFFRFDLMMAFRLVDQLLKSLNVVLSEPQINRLDLLHLWHFWNLVTIFLLQFLSIWCFSSLLILIDSCFYVLYQQILLNYCWILWFLKLLPQLREISCSNTLGIWFWNELGLILFRFYSTAKQLYLVNRLFVRLHRRREQVLYVLKQVRML